jgi:hypothetical protein
MTVKESRDGTDESDIKKLLEEKVVDVLRKELEGRVQKLNERRFGMISGEIEIFDFIKVFDLERDDRFIMVLYIQEEANYYHPRDYSECDFYPMGFSQGVIRKVFRKDLESGNIPRTAFHQISVRSEAVADCYYNTYRPLCLEVTDRKDVEVIEGLVQRAEEFGLREDIIGGEAEVFANILARVENDDTLTFDYRSQYT